MCKVQLIPFGSIPNGCFWFGKDASKEWSVFLLSHVPLFPLIEMPVLRHVIVRNYDTECKFTLYHGQLMLDSCDVRTHYQKNHIFDIFFFYIPDSNLPPDHRFPFVTIVTSDIYDQFSNLNRPSVFRLNIGIGKQTFRSLLGEPLLPSGRDSAAESGENSSDYDFTAL